ncbi:MAG: rhodanese-related sulfurtransferase [Flavobacteriales bacterium]|nr:rhodanese-related sulfurtransferase [Flavobacteriales bacterium]
MKRLHNHIDKRVLKKMMDESTVTRITISFYQYAHIGNPQLFRDHLYTEWEPLGVMGRTYIAKEGINAQISVPKENFEALRDQLNAISFLNGIRLNIAREDDGKSFYKLKIKVRNKIVADGLDDDSFDVTNKGKHLSAAEFNELTDQEDTILIDMRNHYESEVGHFEGAVCPDVDTFREEIEVVTEMLDGKEDKNIVMYCTGGIRCEKASAWFKHQGFENVHQLEGGIIEYARQVEDEGLKNKFKGKNFVFDERRSERITDDVISVCHQCGTPCDEHTNCANKGCNLLFIQCPSCKTKMQNTCCDECQEVVNMPMEKQKVWRKMNTVSNKIYRKGRSDALTFKK